ncbi:MAG TPA: hypothetical protein PLZ51_08215, partial [Aggregatilineales bacterium]|nr:hypothetical protein [Aggregatilineales bacterium]
ELDDFSHALDDLNRAIEQATDDNLSVYMSRASLYAEIGKYREALDDLNKILENRSADMFLRGEAHYLRMMIESNMFEIVPVIKPSKPIQTRKSKKFRSHRKQ